MPEISPFESLLRQVYEALADTSVTFSLFHLPNEPGVVSNQVVWVPTKFKSEQPEINSQALFSEQLIVEAHHHDDTLDGAWSLRARVANAVRRVFKKDAYPLDGHYANIWHDKFLQANVGDVWTWNVGSVLVQRYVWKLNVPLIDGTYVANVKEIDIVDSTQITTVVDGVLTPSETTEIKE